jgi:ketosteroid isomerase-like protein
VASEMLEEGKPLERLADRMEIERLLYRYCRSADLNDPEGLAACFTEDCLAFYAPGPPSVGSAERRLQAEHDLPLFAATSHNLSGIIIDFETPNRARAQSALYAWHRPREGGQDLHLWARYHDVVVRAPAGWLIAERRLLLVGEQGFPEGWSWLTIERAS